MDFFGEVEEKSELFTKRSITWFTLGGAVTILTGTFIFCIYNWINEIDPHEWNLPLKSVFVL